MFQTATEKFHSFKHRFVFGGTSAIITILALIVGLDASANARVNIIVSILLIAVADNISDCLGIHIYQEAEGLTAKELLVSFLTNFTTRFCISVLFVLLVLILPLRWAVISSLILGFFLLSSISCLIARDKGANPYSTVGTHIVVAAAVILASHILGTWIARIL